MPFASLFVALLVCAAAVAQEESTTTTGDPSATASVSAECEPGSLIDERTGECVAVFTASAPFASADEADAFFGALASNDPLNSAVDWPSADETLGETTGKRRVAAWAPARNWNPHVNGACCAAGFFVRSRAAPSQALPQCRDQCECRASALHRTRSFQR